MLPAIILNPTNSNTSSHYQPQQTSMPAAIINLNKLKYLQPLLTSTNSDTTSHYQLQETQILPAIIPRAIINLNKLKYYQPLYLQPSLTSPNSITYNKLVY